MSTLCLLNRGWNFGEVEVLGRLRGVPKWEFNCLFSKRSILGILRCEMSREALSTGGEEEREPLLEEQYTSQTRKGEHGGRHFLKIKEHKRQWMRGKSTKERSFFYAGSWTQLLPQCVSESRQKRKGGKTVQSRPVPGVTGSGRGGHAAAREWPLQKQIVI